MEDGDADRRIDNGRFENRRLRIEDGGGETR
jgi:hypothetical protein